MSESVAELFVSLWRRAAQWGPGRRAAADDLWPTLKRRLLAQLELDEELDVLQGLSDPLAQAALEGREIPVSLAVLKAIDHAFGAVHPRAWAMPATHSRPVVPDWLDDVTAIRNSTGAYFEGDGLRLIPRGPLRRQPTADGSAFNNSLVERFSYLTVVKTTANQEGRELPIRMRVIDPHSLSGFRLPSSPGSETVTFAPIAEEAGDLQHTVVHKAGKAFLDIQPGADLKSAERLVDIIKKSGKSDMLLAPELVMSAADADSFGDALASAAFDKPSLILAGSGLSAEVCDDGLHWNEARVFNSVGRQLWCQRKLLPYRMSSNLAQKYGLIGPGDDEALNEYVQAGEALIVADIDGFGRCVVLICQDFEGEPFVGELVDAYAPDWVYIPVLDTGVDQIRWPHIRSVELSRRSQSRYLVSSSLTMCFWNNSPVKMPPVGLAIGPAHPSADAS